MTDLRAIQTKKRGGLLRKALGLRMGPAKAMIMGERGWGSGGGGASRIAAAGMKVIRRTEMP